MPTEKTFNNLRRKRLIQRKIADRKAFLNSKSEAITPELFDDYATVFGCETPHDSASLADTLAREHGYFENNLSAAETERFSHQTVVGIGQETRGRSKGCFILVLNLLKKLNDGVPGLGFPGGRVRLGETPTSRLMKEYVEESGLIIEIINPDQTVADHRVGEEGHQFMAYKIRVIGGKAVPTFTKAEQIEAVVFVDGKTLEKVCRNDGRINVKNIGPVGVLRNHRLVFLEYLRKEEDRERAKNAQTTTPVKEAANV